MFPLIRPGVRPAGALARRRMEPFGLLRDEFDSLVNRFMTRWAIPEEWFAGAPTWEVTEADKEVVYRMPLAGFEVNEIGLSIVGEEMTLRAEHAPAPGAPDNRESLPLERVEVTVTLPAGLETEKVEARFHNGLLEVHMPRVPAAVPRHIEVTT
jgi:HSP20 family protein